MFRNVKCSISKRAVLGSFIFLGIARSGVAQEVRAYPIPAKHIAYDATTKKVYLSVGGEGEGNYANSVVPIDVVSGRVEEPLFVGTDPGALVVSDKSKYLYIAVNDNKSVRRLTLNPLASGPLYPIGDGLALNTLRSVYGNPDAFIAQRHRPGQSPSDNGVALYVNGTVKPESVGMGHSLTQGIHPTRLIGYENQLSSWNFVNAFVFEDGVYGSGSSGSVLSGNTWFSAILNGLVMLNDGKVLDPETRRNIGRLPSRDGSFVGDPERNVMFQVTGNDGKYVVNKYEFKQFQKIGTMPFEVLGAKGGPQELTCLGTDGLAFATNNGVVLVNGNYGPKVPAVDLSVTRGELSKGDSPGEFVYTLTVENKSTRASNGAYLSETLPHNTDVTDVKASQGTANSNGGIISAELGPIAASASATVKIKIIPHNDENPVFVAVVRGEDPDSNTANNISVFAPIANLKLPDLTGDWRTLQQVTIGAGVNIQTGIAGAFTVKNIGKDPSVETVVRFYLSVDFGFRVELCPLIQERVIPALKVGQTYTISLEAPLGQDDVTGFYVYASIDPNKRMRETNRNNNVVGKKIP